MTAIHYHITIGDRTYDAHAQALDAHASLFVPVNQCRVLMHPGVGVTLGAPVIVAVARDDEEPRQVFAGEVSAIERRMDRVAVTGSSRFRRLVRAHMNRSYSRVHAGDIARDMLGAFDVPLAASEPGIAYPSFTVADNRPVYWTLAHLARASGLAFYATHEDRAVFADPMRDAGQAHAFRHGENIVHYAVEDSEPASAGVEVHGAGSASLRGAGAYSWPSTRAVRAQAGAEPRSPVRDAALRDVASVQTAAMAHASRLYTRKLRVRVTLRPDIGLGDAALVSDREERAYSGHITSVRHRVHKRWGAITDLQVYTSSSRE